MKLKRLFVAVVALLSFGTVMAQQMQMPPIPQDKDVKVGHLDNGLTYYIRHNAYPEGVASFYIAQRVGSIQEEESQRGLAHLLEHLAFNGTDHFKDNDLQEWLQSVGVEYGRNLNAYTSTDETVYYFTDVPTKRASVVDSCMMILKDWSNGISLTDKAINDERDIVHTEYRMRMIGQQRLLERQLPNLYPGSKYGLRMPIGLMEVIDKCNPEEIRAYYRKWYRPDNQAIIIVGDIDVDKIEGKIKELFSGIVVPADAAQVVEEAVPDNDEAIYLVDKDKEMRADVILGFIKSDPMPKEMKNTMMYLLQQYMINVSEMMLSERFSDKSNDPACPFLQAGASYGNFLVSKTKDATTFQCVPKPGKALEAYEATLLELKRAAEFGFTATEFIRAKEEFMSQMEKQYANRDKMKNQEFTGQYVQNFTSGEPIPSLEDEYQMYQQISGMLPLEAINQVAKEMYNVMDDKNFITFAMLIEKDDATYPTPEQLAAVVAKVRETKVEAFVDNVKQEPLIAQAPKAGKITKTTENKQLGFKQLQLSNGAKVILKKTDYKDNEIQLSAWANGGYSAFPASRSTEMSFLGQIAGCSGLGNFSNNELTKALAGKQAMVGFTIDELTHGLSGNSTPKDIETMMQLLYLNMTAMGKDEKNFENVRQQIITILSNKDNNPQLIYQDSLGSTVYPGNPYQRIPDIESIKAIDYDRCLQTIRELNSNAKDFTFVFVGNFDEATLLPLIETYIASLPTSKQTYKNTQFNMVKGEAKCKFDKAMANPQSQVSEFWISAPMANSLKNRVTLDIAGRMLEMTYNRSIREELSAAYHAGASSGFEPNLDGTLTYYINGDAQLNPDKLNEALPCFFTGMESTIKEPKAEDLQKVKEILLKQADVNAKTNGYWLGTIIKYLKYGIDFHTDYKATVEATDAKAVSEFLKNVIMASGNHAEVIMNAVPETK